MSNAAYIVRKASFAVVAILAGASCGMAGQTGAFDAFGHPAWACSSREAIAEVMTRKTPAGMKAAAERRGNCRLIPAGTSVWVHGGDALIEEGGIDGMDTLMYWPAAAVNGG